MPLGQQSQHLIIASLSRVAYLHPAPSRPFRALRANGNFLALSPYCPIIWSFSCSFHRKIRIQNWLVSYPVQTSSRDTGCSVVSQEHLRHWETSRPAAHFRIPYFWATSGNGKASRIPETPILFYFCHSSSTLFALPIARVGSHGLT